VTSRRRTGMPTLYVDFLFLMLLAFLILINPPTNPTEAIVDSPGNMMVTIAWPNGPIDVDLWVQGPGDDKGIGYSNRGGKTFNLLRDDLGSVGDSAPYNREDAFSRGLPEGEYVVNLHGYSLEGPIPVSVEVRLANADGATLLVKTNVTLRPKQELTVTRFRLNADGKVVNGSMGTVFKPLRSAK
jgi:hypothetical protein